MVFSSTVFLFIFLPAVWAIYSLVPKKYLKFRNIILCIASTVFYAFGEPVYILLMLASVTFNYFAARLLYNRNDRLKNIICALTVVINLAVLALFKYVPWLVGMANNILPLKLPVPDLTIPVGISFYTFQILSYVIDVKRGKCEVQKNYISLFLYISFFPQLIAGPIVKYGDIAAQIENREVTLDKTAYGIKRFITGLSKKVLISNSAAFIADAAFAAVMPSSALAWAGAFSYSIQLFFDFSGYSDMAIGLASMFGFELNENFRYPYTAVSVCDFWKRWHISLTSWFREYVYYPLGGNRCSRKRAMFNRFTVFFLSGLWHGANLTYVLWGIWHGVLMVIEQMTGMNKAAEKKGVKPFMRAYTLLAVVLGFVIFRAADITSGFSFIGRMFSFSGNCADLLQYLSPWAVIMLIAGMVFSTPVVPYINNILKKTERGTQVSAFLSYAFAAVLLVLSAGALVSSSFNPFIYYIF